MTSNEFVDCLDSRLLVLENDFPSTAFTSFVTPRRIHGIQAAAAFIDKNPARDTRYPLSPNARPAIICANLPSPN
jgi:hypothetical protein